MGTQKQDALFEDSAKKRKTEKEKSKNTQGFNFDPILFSPFITNDYSVFRILGNPADNRNGDSTSPKIIFISMIMGDDDKPFRCIWPHKGTPEGNSWLLWKVFNKVMSYKWDSTAEKRRYHYEENHPNIFNRVSKNGKPQNKFERGWTPSKTVVMNVINRDMMEEHKEHKKTFVISKKVSESKDGRLFYEPGIPYTTYSQIWDEIVGAWGNWQDYDVVVQKLTEDPFYRVYHAENDFQKLINITDGSIKEKINPDLSTRPLTEEELSWERYDLDKLYKVTSATKIYYKLSVFIKSVDAAFGTKYSEELDTLVELEKKEKASDSTTYSTSSSSDSDDDVFSDDSEEDGNVFSADEEDFENSPSEEEKPKVETPKVRERKTSASEEKSEYAVDFEALADSYEGIKDMTDKEKSVVTGFDADKGTFTYNDDIGDLFVCLNEKNGCTMLSPEFYHACPACGSAF